MHASIAMCCLQYVYMSCDLLWLYASVCLTHCMHIYMCILYNQSPTHNNLTPKDSQHVCVSNIFLILMLLYT